MNTSSWDRHPAWYGLPFLLLLVAFAVVPSGGFVSDDVPMIAENPALLSWKSVPGFFTGDVWKSSALAASGGGLYRPLYLLWYFLLAQVFGPGPMVFHVAMLVLHVTNVVLALFLLKRLLPQAPAAARAIGVTAFAIHPAQVETVAWISGGTDIVMATWLLGACLAWLRYRTTGSRLALALSLVAFVGAMFTKESAVVFPLLLFTLERLQQPGVTPRWLVPAVTGVLALGYLGLRGSVLGGGSSGWVIDPSRFLRLLEYLAFHLRVLAWPDPLPFYFRHPEAGVVGAVAAMVACVTAIGLARLGRAPGARVAWPWFLFLLPTLALAFHSEGTVALRFLYLPMFGIAVLVAATSARPGRAGQTALVLALLAGLTWTAIAYRASAVFHDDGTFFSAVRVADPTSPSGYEGLGNHLLRKGRTEDALAVFAEGALRTRVAGRHLDLLAMQARLLGELGRSSESMAAYRRYLADGGRLALGYNGIGNNLWIIGDRVGAAENYRLALNADPRDFEAAFNLAQLAEVSGDVELARAYYTRALANAKRDTPPLAVAQTRAKLARGR